MLVRIPSFRERSSGSTPPKSFWAGIDLQPGLPDAYAEAGRFEHPLETIRPKREGESDTEDEDMDEDGDEHQASYIRLGGGALALV